jgi:hypothetical protein
MVLFLYIWFCALSFIFIIQLIFGPTYKGLSAILAPIAVIYNYLICFFCYFRFFN